MIMIRKIILWIMLLFFAACDNNGKIKTTENLQETAAAVEMDAFDINQFYPFDKGHSYIGFSIRYMGFANLRGRFADFSGSFRYDPNDITKTSATVFIWVKSLNTENENRDKDLKSDNWFDTGKFPLMKFQSTGAVKTESGFDITGKLTIKDVTKEINIKMDYCSGIQQDIRGDEQVIFNGSTVIDRKLFGVKGENWSKLKEGITAVDADVEIELTILGKQLKESNARSWLGKTESLQSKIYETTIKNGADSGIALFRAIRLADEKKVDSRILNTVGYLLLKEGKIDEAILLLEENALVFANDRFVFGNLGEAHAIKGNLQKARQYYQKALSIDSLSANAIEILRHIQ
jgi:polyisoprenoid-binding protein YceI